MKSFRTSIVVASAVAALSWSGLVRAEDDVNSKKGTTKSQSSTSSSTTDTDVPTTTDTTGTAPSDTSTPTTPSTSTDTSWGTGSDSAYGTGYGTTQPTQPYQQAQQQPAQTQTTTVSTTTTTAAAYNERASADHDGWLHRPHRPLLYTGLGILVGTYATSVVVGASSDKDVDKRLYIPVAGPWLDLAQRDCGLGDCGQTEDWNQALLIGSGALQGIGTVLTLASFFKQEENVSPPSAAAKRATSTAAAKPTIQVLPMNMRGGGGFGAVGTF
jgi:hypothetical protein